MAGIQHGRQNFIVNVDQAKSLFRDLRRFSRDSRDAITDETHAIVQAVLIVGARFRPGLSRSGIGYTRNIFVGQHGMDAG